MNFKKITLIAIRILIGIVFVLSAVTKYISIEAFDMFVFEHELFSWNLTNFITRILIASEACLGLMLLFGIFPKLSRWLTVGSLVIFTIYILIKPFFFEVNSDNCHCFGEVMILSDNQTLIKNVVLLLFSTVLFFDKGWKLKYAKYILIASFILPLATTFIVRPPDVIAHAIYGKQIELNMDSFEKLLNMDKVQDMKVSEGKKVLCLYSTACKHCKRTAIKIDVIIKRHKLNKQDFVVLFWGKENSIDVFYKETAAELLPTNQVPPLLFLSATKGRQPIIVLLDNGRIVDLYKSTNINEQKIVEFLN
jgi:uncharacterized membrane protein YphA (DoxX/SURF4 family)